MRKRIRRHQDVADDILDLAAYIARDSLPTALRFLDAVEVTLAWLLRRPGAGSLREFDEPALANVRSWAVKGFRNHLILYEIEEKGDLRLVREPRGAGSTPRSTRPGVITAAEPVGRGRAGSILVVPPGSRRVYSFWLSDHRHRAHCPYGSCVSAPGDE
jgi:plasmid stabilization system protein ParE